ncbi:BatD family protein [Prolixibacteraceae bacterium]|nr:BatD family protein [Prolixibacteraceae bacterium]
MIVKKISCFLLMILCSGNVFADNTQVKLSIPNMAQVGQQIRLAIESNKQIDQVNLPSLSNFEILQGPITSSSTSFQVLDGKTSRTNTYASVYVLKPTKDGIFVIPPIEVIVDGQTFNTKEKKIKIVKNNSVSKTTYPNTEFSSKDVFVKILLSQTNVKEGQATLATTKLYTRVPISNVSNIEIPNFTNFYSRSIGETNLETPSKEVFDGDIYSTVVLNKTLLFPQKEGKIKIDPVKVSVQARQQLLTPQEHLDVLSSLYKTFNLDIESTPCFVQVNALPTSPTSYSGAIGKFNVKASLSKTDITEGDTITLRLTIEGKGNLSILNRPKLDLPKDFKMVYSRSKDHIEITDTGEQGSKTIEYLIKPQVAGDYTIPTISFSYYSPLHGKYITEQTKPFHIRVTPTNGKHKLVDRRR